MTGRDSWVREDVLEEVAFMSRSVNRVAILDVLTERPVTRRELAEVTETPRTTLDRIVNELEDRNWAGRTADGTYAATARGRQFMRHFRPLLGAVVALERLDEAVDWLPTDELTIGLEHFADATVYRPEGSDPVETIDLMVEMVRDASEYRALSHLIPPVPIAEATLEGLESGRLSTDGVLTAESVEFLREDPERRERWAAIADAGARLYRYAGTLPCNLWIMDQAVLIKKSGPEPFTESYGVPIVSEDATVRRWAGELVDRYEADSVRLGPDDFRVPAGSSP